MLFLPQKPIPEEKTKTIQKRISGYIIHDHPQRITTSLLFHDALRRRGSVCAAGNVPKWFKRTTEAKPRVPLKKILSIPFNLLKMYEIVERCTLREWETTNVHMALINPPAIKYANSRFTIIKPPVLKYANFFPRFFPLFPFSIRFQLGNSFGNT